MVRKYRTYFSHHHPTFGPAVVNLINKFGMLVQFIMLKVMTVPRTSRSLENIAVVCESVNQRLSTLILYLS